MKKLITKYDKNKLILALNFLAIILCSTAYSHVDTGGSATTRDHSKQIVGYITNWDAWKSNNAGVPAQGALTHLNIDYNKYTILNYSFFGVASDGSLHSGDHRNKDIWQSDESQQPSDLLYTDIYSSWDLHILFGEIEPIHYINDTTKLRCEAQGFNVETGGSSWTHPTWGLSGSLPVPLHKEGGAPGLLELAHDKGVKVMASIGGWSMSKHFHEMAGDPAKRQRFIDDCKKLMKIGFDGIDLDWEYPGPFEGMNFTGTQADYDNFLTLVKEIRSAIGQDKLITAAFSASPAKLQGFDWQELNYHMDHFNFMTYDYNGGWSDITGFNSNIYDYNGSEAPGFNWETLYKFIANQSIPLEKVNFGLPFYGRGMICKNTAELNGQTRKTSNLVQPDGPIITSADYTNWPKDVYDGTPNYFFIKQTALGNNSPWNYHWNDEAKVPYLTNENYFLTYDDVDSIGIKSQFIMDHDLGGAIVWTVYGDLELSGTVTSFGAKLKQWSDVKSPLINKANEVFAGDNSLNVNAGGPYAGIIETALQITAQAHGGVEPYTYSWDFGDNTSGSGKTVSHTYYLEGSYTVTLTVTDNTNNMVTDSTTVNITGIAPLTCNAGGPYSGTINTGITIAGQASGGTPPYNFAWDFGDGSDGLEDSTSHAYDLQNTYTLTLTVTDSANTKSTDSTMVTVIPGVSCDAQAWDAAKVYLVEDEASYNGHLYRAQWWTKGDEPGTTGPWGVWEDKGECGGIPMCQDSCRLNPSRNI